MQISKRKGTWGKAPVVAAMMALSMLALSGCRVEGDTHVRSQIGLKNKDGRFKNLMPGVYKTAAAYDKNDDRLDVKIKIRGDWERFYFNLPHGASLPTHSGTLDVAAAQTGQAYDLRATADTTYSSSTPSYDTESCVLGYHRVERCRPVCTNGICRRECTWFDETIYGRRDVVYHFEYRTTGQQLQLKTAGTQDVVAQFSHSDTDTNRVVDNVGQCR